MAIPESGLTSPVGLLRGGSTGQVLQKSSSTDYDVEWGADPTDFISGKTVANYSALPSAAANSGKLAIALASQGVWLINYKAAGIYYSDGATWTYQGDYELTDVASEIGYTPTAPFTPTNVQTALDTIKAFAGNYQTLINLCSSQTAGVAVGTYPLAYQRAANGTTAPSAIIPIYAADYASFGGLTPKLRIRAQVDTNNTAPDASFQFALYPVSDTAGAASNISYTLGTVVTGSETTTATTPAASSQTSLVGSDFALPSDGQYVIGVIQTTATTAASSFTALTAQLQLHYG